MVEHCDFDTQVSASAAGVDGSGVRPDMIIRLSGGRQIPVDAKVPFAAWLEALDCTDDRRRGALMAAHARALRGHVDALAAKAYWRHFQPAPEFVVLFVPGEPLLDAALAMDPGLSDHAFGRQCGDRDTDLVDRLAPDDRLHLAAGAAVGIGGRGTCPRSGVARPVGHTRRAPQCPGCGAGTCGAVLQPHSPVHGEQGSGDGSAVHRSRRDGRGNRRPGTRRHRAPARRKQRSSCSIRPRLPRSRRCEVPHRRAWDATVDG